MEESELLDRLNKWGIDDHMHRVMGYLHSDFKKGKTPETIDIESFNEYCARFYGRSAYSPSDRIEILTIAYDIWLYLKPSGRYFIDLVEAVGRRKNRKIHKTPEEIGYRKVIGFLFSEYGKGKKPEDIDIKYLTSIIPDYYKDNWEGEGSLIDKMLISTYDNWVSAKEDRQAEQEQIMFRLPDLEQLKRKFPVLEKNLIWRKAIELQDKLAKEGKNARIFDNLDDVLNAIAENREIEGCDIIKEMSKSESFRFICSDNLEKSVLISDAIAATVATVSKNIAESIAKSTAELVASSTKKARDVRSQNADEYAKEMYETVNRLKREQKVSTFRATVDMLNREEIPTPNGKRWHIGSLQSLNKRWQDLGLGPDPE